VVVQCWARNPPRASPTASAWARGAKGGAHSVASGMEEGRDRVSHACDTRGHTKGGVRGTDEYIGRHRKRRGMCGEGRGMCESVPGAGGSTSAGNPGGDLGLRGETALLWSKNPCCIEEVGDDMEVPFCVLLRARCQVR
jgi:hypothetical protein